MAENKKVLIGRQSEQEQLNVAISLGRNVLVEGGVGVGKTYLILRVLEKLKLKFERVDGDTRYTEQKLTGWFDPPLVLKTGYSKKSFIPGPLVTAMTEGKVLFVNELNRMPEAVQNILLPAMDEKQIVIPKIGEVIAKRGFSVVATQNPAEFTATHALSEALLDRFEMVHLPYQSREEEIDILKSVFKQNGKLPIEAIVDVVRGSRNHPAIRRGASLRAAISVAELVGEGLDLTHACYMALPSRIELSSTEDSVMSVIDSLIAGNISAAKEKKKTLS